MGRTTVKFIGENGEVATVVVDVNDDTIDVDAEFNPPITKKTQSEAYGLSQLFIQALTSE